MTDEHLPPEIAVSGNVVRVTLMYPCINDGRPDTVEIDQESVRSSDPIRVTYDYDRDGWSILQASVFEWPADDMEHDQDWQEVAFVPAWGREKRREA